MHMYIQYIHVTPQADPHGMSKVLYSPVPTKSSVFATVHMYSTFQGANGRQVTEPETRHIFSWR